jgi:hypothetical protein
MLLYDHILTFSGEVRATASLPASNDRPMDDDAQVQYIWTGHKGPIIWLFFIVSPYFSASSSVTPQLTMAAQNRYFAPVTWTLVLRGQTTSLDPTLVLFFRTNSEIIFVEYISPSRTLAVS